MSCPIRRVLIAISLVTATCLFPSGTWAQLRIVTYNTTPTINETRLRRVMLEIESESVNGIARPIDILALQEQGSQEVETQQILDILNGLYGEGVYSRGVVNGSGFFTQGVIYRNDTVNLVEEVRIGSTSPQGAARQTLRYRFQPVGYKNADFYLYNSHFKANNNPEDAARRAVEAAAIRRNADSLGNVPIIFLGDFNLYSDQSPAYQALTAAGPAQAFDPIAMKGNWHQNRDFKIVHTQSTTLSGGDNRAGGGVDDRFDFQLVTGQLMDGEGLSYIGPNLPNLGSPVSEHSYRVFGNNGTHTMGQNIGSGTGASRVVLRTLETASDHLPVVVDYQLPAIPNMWATHSEKIMVGTDSTATIHVENAARVQTPNGADELEYSITGPSGILANGYLLPNQESDHIALSLDTLQVGSQNSSVVFETSSPMVSRSTIVEDIEYLIVDHSNASLVPDADLNSITINLGDLQQFSEAKFQVPIYNLPSPLGETADLVVERAASVDFMENTDFPLSVGPGEFAFLHGSFDTTRHGFRTSLVHVFSGDESIPGARSGQPLEVTLTATVTGLPGDFNFDGALNADDILGLTRAAESQTNDPAFDLNRDGLVNFDDREIWVQELKRTFFGDANLDGQFNSTDFVTVFRAGEYDDSVSHNSSWATGDWNGDLEFDSSDFVLAFRSGAYEKGPRPLAVPETRAAFSAALFYVAALFSRRQRFNVRLGCKSV